MKRPKDKLHAGIDLHSNNLTIGLMNHEGKRVAHWTLDCKLSDVVDFLKPYRAQVESMAVESTFNWYWLVDGLRKLNYPIDLANPAKIEQYNGLKHMSFGRASETSSTSETKRKQVTKVQFDPSSVP